MQTSYRSQNLWLYLCLSPLDSKGKVGQGFSLHKKTCCQTLSNYFASNEGIFSICIKKSYYLLLEALRKWKRDLRRKGNIKGKNMGDSWEFFLMWVCGRVSGIMIHIGQPNWFGFELQLIDGAKQGGYVFYSSTPAPYTPLTYLGQ